MEAQFILSPAEALARREKQKILAAAKAKAKKVAPATVVTQVVLTGPAAAGKKGGGKDAPPLPATAGKKTNIGGAGHNKGPSTPAKKVFADSQSAKKRAQKEAARK
jgi:hypothetical protein